MLERFSIVSGGFFQHQHVSLAGERTERLLPPDRQT